MTQITKGQYRVGVSFNPSGDETVTEIKRLAALLIDAIDGIPMIPGIGKDDPIDVDHAEWLNERNRLKALAMTAVEDGAMWAVKAATKPQR